MRKKPATKAAQTRKALHKSKKKKVKPAKRRELSSSEAAKPTEDLVAGLFLIAKGEFVHTIEDGFVLPIVGSVRIFRDRAEAQNFIDGEIAAHAKMENPEHESAFIDATVEKASKFFATSWHWDINQNELTCMISPKREAQSRKNALKNHRWALLDELKGFKTAIRNTEKELKAFDKKYGGKR